MDALTLPAEGRPFSEEARMRTFALQLLYLMRVHAAPAAPPAVWTAVEALEAALRNEPFPPDSEAWKASVLMNAWEDVTRTQRSVSGWGWRTAAAVNAAVSAAMSAVCEAHSADRAASRNDLYKEIFDEAFHKRSDVALKVGRACLIASELGVPTAYFEPFRALQLADHPSTVPGYSWWKQQERTVSDSDRLRDFASDTIRAVSFHAGLSEATTDKIRFALLKGDDAALTAGIEEVSAVIAAAHARGFALADDPETGGPLLFERTALLAIKAMFDARRADAYRKRSAQTDDPNECQWLKKAADAIIVAAHQKALAVCAEAEAAGIWPLELAYMRSRLPVSGL
jgi:hypothetical protein